MTVGAFDIDGTVLHHRQKPDYLSIDSLALAKPDVHVCARVRSLIEAGTQVHFVTGRCHPVKEFTVGQLRSFIHPSIKPEHVHTQDEFTGYETLAKWKGQVLRNLGAMFYVGDHDCDRQAAAIAGIPFQDADKYAATSRTFTLAVA